MAGTGVWKAFEVQPSPYLIEVNDGGGALTAFLAGLSAASLTDNANESAKHDKHSLLWAVALKDGVGHGTDSGTAYVVSAEAYKRIKAKRYSGSPTS